MHNVDKITKERIRSTGGYPYVISSIITDKRSG